MNNLSFQIDDLRHEAILLLLMPKNQLLPFGSLDSFLLFYIVQVFLKQLKSPECSIFGYPTENRVH